MRSNRFVKQQMDTKLHLWALLPIIILKWTFKFDVFRKNKCFIWKWGIKQGPITGVQGCNEQKHTDEQKISFLFFRINKDSGGLFKTAVTLRTYFANWRLQIIVKMSERMITGRKISRYGRSWLFEEKTIIDVQERQNWGGWCHVRSESDHLSQKVEEGLSRSHRRLVGPWFF